MDRQKKREPSLFVDGFAFFAANFLSEPNQMTHTAHITQKGYTNHILQPSRHIGFEPPKLKRGEPDLFGVINEYSDSEEEDEDEGIIDLGIDSDDDDPTNTAMFLDESEERELDGVTPGTPMAFRKLEQMTTKSINRQRESQTPGRTPRSSIKRNQQYPLEWDGNWPRYANAADESPTKRKGNDRLLPITSLKPAKMLADINLATAKQAKRGTDDTAGTVPLSIQKIRSSRRAGNILSKIRAANNSHQPPKPLDFGQVKDRVDRGPPQPPLTTETNAVLDMERIFNSDEYSSVEFDSSEAEAVADGHRTPPNGNEDPKPAMPMAETPYTLLRTLSGRTNFGPASMAALRPLQEEECEDDGNATTPTKQMPKIGSAATTPMTQPRERIDSLKRLYKKHIIPTNQQPGELADGMVTPVRGSGMPINNNNNILISFDNGAIEESRMNSAKQTNRAPSGRRWDNDSVINLLGSPSPVRPDNGPPARNGSTSSLLLSFSSKANQSQPPSADPNKQPIAYLLNHVLKQHQENLNRERNDRSNLLDMSSRLNSSIHALNSGLRDHLNQSRTPGGEGGALTNRRDLGAVTETMEKVENDINQSLASMVPRAEGAHTADAHPLHNELGLEEQVNTLRQTMMETKEIVFIIQNKLDQQQHQRSPTMTEHSMSSDSSKLDDIVRLLGALDMRLHMLEDRQRLDHKGTQRTNSGSVKLNANKRQQRPYWGLDMLSQIGQFIAYCLSRYPFMLLGALFIILMSELLVIGSFGSSAQSLRKMGSYVFDEVRKQLTLQMPQQDVLS